MSLVASEMTAADIAAVTGNNGNGGWGWGGESIWIIILFLALFSGGWGNGFGGGFGGGGAVPYMMYNNTNSDVQRGFDQSAIMGGINGINSALSAAEVSRCNAQTNVLQALNNNQANLTNQLNTIAMNQQNCCCENRQAVADLRYSVATEACADRAAVESALRDVTAQNNANTQRILDQMCNDKIDAKNEQIAALQNQLTMANLAASQTAQTARLLADNAAQTTALEQYLNPTPIPAYIVPQNYGWNNYNCGCNGYAA